MEEIRDEVALLLRESDLEKAERLELMWNQISQGNSRHAEFRAKWNAMLDDIDDEPPQVREPDSLYRRYLKSIKTDLRTAVLRKDSAIKTPTGIDYRRPRIWQELAECCENELECRIDTQATGERINRMHEPTGLTAAVKKSAQEATPQRSRAAC